MLLFKFCGLIFSVNSKKVYDKILHKFANKPIESGGIIGIKNDIIVAFYFDDSALNSIDTYIPSLEKLDKVLEKWDKKDIKFAGFIHSHENNYNRLSNNDIKYIESLYSCFKNDLFFPIVTYVNGNVFLNVYKYDGEIKKENLYFV